MHRILFCFTLPRSAESFSRSASAADLFVFISENAKLPTFPVHIGKFKHRGGVYGIKLGNNFFT
jgi:hypothetical protein